MTQHTFTHKEYEGLFNDVFNKHDTMSTTDKAAFGGCLVRAAGHDFMDFRLGKKRDQSDATGGPDGCFHFDDPDNKGLKECMTKFDMPAVYANWCDKVSLADFFVIIAESVQAQLATDFNAANPFADGTLAQRFRKQFHVGRQTLEQCPDNVGLMPNPEAGCEGLQEVFVNNIFKKKFGKWKGWKATAAISGAHTLGSAKLENSGYNGHWSDPKE